MRSMNEIRMNDFNLEASFTRLCQQAEQEDRQTIMNRMKMMGMNKITSFA